MTVNRTIIAAFALAIAVQTGAEDWPRWRGPNDNGSTPTGTYPVKWNATDNLLWKVPLPGKGCSTPIVWNQRIYLTAPVEDNDAVLAFDWSGKLLWQRPLGAERAGRHRNGSGSNPSPATDGQAVFVYFKSGRLACVEFDGKLRWQTSLQERFGGDNLYWDIGTSPVLTEKDVVVAVMQNGGSYLAAFDKRSGALHWKVARDYETPVEGDHSYATPILVGQTLLVWGAQHLTAHDPATGKTLWDCGDFNPEAKRNWPAVTSTVVAGDMVVVPYGRGTRLHGITLAGKRAWKREDTGTFVPSPAEYRGRVYLVRDKGEVECIEPATGNAVWSDKLPKNANSYYSSPTIAGGKLYAAREDGMVYVAQVDGKFELLAENDMAERLIAAPVPVANRLLIRGEKHLFCVGAK